MEKILVSACLLGEPVRWDGKGAPSGSGILQRWQEEGRIVPICPEMAGGLPVPRPPAEIVGGGGADVLQGRGLVKALAAVPMGRGPAPAASLIIDVTDAFLRGSDAALALAREHGIRIAVLKERSPSCGSRLIFDGSFSGKLVQDEGVTTALLRQHGIRVFSEEELPEAAAHLARL